MIYPNSLNNLIEAFKRLPGVGEKTAERLAFAVMDFDDLTAEELAESLLDVKKKVKRCKICNHLTEKDICHICDDSSREKDILCVVESSKTVFLFEKMGTYKGLYHILGGLISPLDGVNPSDIKIESLVKRLEKGKFKEVIFALKSSIEGETTMLYIKKIISGCDVAVSKIAYGIPIGADMEYIDPITLETALTDRKNIS